MTSPRLCWLLTCGSRVTSASDVWVQSVYATDRWVRSTVNGDRSTVNTGRVQTGPGQGSGWAGLGRTDPDTWHAVVQPRHVHGLLLGCGLRFTVDLGVLVHGPQTGLRWTESTLRLPGVVQVYPVHLRVTSEGEVLCFSRGGAPAGGELAVSPCGGAGVRLGRGKTSPGHGDCVCGVKVATRAPQGAGHGERRLGSACRR